MLKISFTGALPAPPTDPASQAVSPDESAPPLMLDSGREFYGYIRSWYPHDGKYGGTGSGWISCSESFHLVRTHIHFCASTCHGVLADMIREKTSIRNTAVRFCIMAAPERKSRWQAFDYGVHVQLSHCLISSASVQ